MKKNLKRVVYTFMGLQSLASGRSHITELLGLQSMLQMTRNTSVMFSARVP